MAYFGGIFKNLYTFHFISSSACCSGVCHKLLFDGFTDLFHPLSLLINRVSFTSCNLDVNEHIEKYLSPNFKATLNAQVVVQFRRLDTSEKSVVQGKGFWFSLTQLLISFLPFFAPQGLAFLLYFFGKKKEKKKLFASLKIANQITQYTHDHHILVIVVRFSNISFISFTGQSAIHNLY